MMDCTSSISTRIPVDNLVLEPAPRNRVRCNLRAPTPMISPEDKDRNKMNEMKLFENPEFGKIRTIVKDGEPWFVGKDVAKALGYADATQAVDFNCKFMVRDTINSGFGDKETKIIPESDLYRLIMRSRLPSAEKFQDWVMEEVLPSIRKTGKYAVEEIPKDALFYARALIESEEAKLALAQKNKELEGDNVKLALAVLDRNNIVVDNIGLELELSSARSTISRQDEAIDIIVSHNTKGIPVDDVGRESNIGPRKIWSWLDANGWVFKDKRGYHAKHKARNWLIQINTKTIFANGSYTTYDPNDAQHIALVRNGTAIKENTTVRFSHLGRIKLLEMVDLGNKQ